MALPKRSLTPDNQAESIIEDDQIQQTFRNLNFKVPPDFRRRFKDRANAEDISGIELLKRALAAYEAQQGAA